MTMVADTSRIRATLDWTPQYDDLETIAAHALAWEEKLFRERHGELQHARIGLKSSRRKPLIGLEKPRHSGQEDASRSIPDARRAISGPAPSMERGWPNFQRKSPTIPMARRS